MLKLGIIGANEGNGHPYSYSAIFNGYNPKFIETCPYAAIRSYIPNIHQNKHIISEAAVTHIWTQDIEESRRIARFANIPNITNNLEDLIGKVDAVILARDDIENHWKIAEPFIKHGMPLFIDKLLTDNFNDLHQLLHCKKKSGTPVMAVSPSRYTPEIKRAFDLIKSDNTTSYIHGTSLVSWLRYANHLLDGICYLFGTGFESVQNLSQDDHNDIVHIKFKNGLDCILTINNKFSLPISFSIHSNQNVIEVPYTDEGFSSYFFGFYNMLEDFVSFVKTGISAIKFEDSIKISSLIIAAHNSKVNGNKKYKQSQIIPTHIQKFI